MNRHEMKITPKESKALDWCYAALTEEQIAECEEEASQIAGAELHQHEAAELLVKLYVRMIVRNVRGETNGGAR